jgi:hypothetical protein
MPVTAKLSRAFYEKFGDAVVNELVDWLNQVDATYRLELRELNYARFDAKLEQRIAEVKADVRQEIAALRGHTDSGLAGLEGRLLARLGLIEGRFGTMEGRLVRWMFALWVATIGAALLLPLVPR